MEKALERIFSDWNIGVRGIPLANRKDKNFCLIVDEGLYMAKILLCTGLFYSQGNYGN